MIVAFIDDHKHEHGVEPICRVLTTHGIPIAPSTYYAFRSRPASRRALTDAGLVRLIAEVHQANYGVDGVRKVWHELRRQGHADVARCTVERLMRINGLRGVSKAKAPRTTIPAGAPTPEDKVNRQFTAQARAALRRSACIPAHTANGTLGRTEASTSAAKSSDSDAPISRATTSGTTPNSENNPSRSRHSAARNSDSPVGSSAATNPAAALRT